MFSWSKLSMIILVVSLMIFITGCSTTLELSSAIPFQSQQLIKSIKSTNGIGFRYVSNSKGNNINIPQGLYSINKPLESLLSELVQTKFGNISTDSKDSIIVTLKKVETDGSTNFSDNSMSLSLTVGIQVIKNHELFSNSFSYDMNNTYIHANLVKNDLDNFLMKYVITIDKYIDTQFNIQ